MAAKKKAATKKTAAKKGTTKKQARKGALSKKGAATKKSTTKGKTAGRKPSAGIGTSALIKKGKGTPVMAARKQIVELVPGKGMKKSLLAKKAAKELGISGEAAGKHIDACVAKKFLTAR